MTACLQITGMPFLCMLCRNGIVCCAVAGYHAYDAGMWRRPGVAGAFFREELALRRRHLELSSHAGRE